MSFVSDPWPFGCPSLQDFGRSDIRFHGRSCLAAMPLSVSAKSKSHRSSRSLPSAANGDLEKGPVMRNNILYVQIRRCSCCSLTNACPNPIKFGVLGVDHVPTVPWASGSSTSPSGRLDKICQYTWVNGGFAAQFNNDLNAFLEARRNSQPLMAEWQAAYVVCLKLFERGVIRVTKGLEGEMISLMEEARRKVVDVFKTEQKRVNSKYRAVLRSSVQLGCCSAS